MFKKLKFLAKEKESVSSVHEDYKTILSDFSKAKYSFENTNEILKYCNDRKIEEGICNYIAEKYGKPNVELFESLQSRFFRSIKTNINSIYVCETILNIIVTNDNIENVLSKSISSLEYRIQVLNKTKKEIEMEIELLISGYYNLFVGIMSGIFLTIIVRFFIRLLFNV